MQSSGLQRSNRRPDSFLATTLQGSARFSGIQPKRRARFHAKGALKELKEKKLNPGELERILDDVSGFARITRKLVLPRMESGGLLVDHELVIGYS
jgi:hypothetical protein